MYEFDYTRPTSLQSALEALRGEDVKPIAGGMSIVPVMRHRLARAEALVDLSRIHELKGISEEPSAIRIGAMTNHFTVSRSDIVRAKIPALVQLAGGIGDPLVRNRGTIGGSISHNDPAACYPSSILALGATIHTSKRSVAADDFITGTFSTVLEDGELVVAVSFPVPEQAAYIKFINSSSRFSIVGVFLARHRTGVRVGITGAGHRAFRASALERALNEAFKPDKARSVAISPDALLSDIHGSAEYRAHLIPELTARAVEHCIAGTPGAIV
jgi:carbon-monoxide dehydrogenase medium subunit